MHSHLGSSSHAIGGAFAVVQRTRAIYPRTVPEALIQALPEHPIPLRVPCDHDTAFKTRTGYASLRGRLSAQLPSSFG